ncbi:hypothetical protein F5Y19DRAFT_33078 [Xylariaceae sp. FL1651]|nr:hypothetical protein F5Y19DRAFT_33078 [Xylariaceae sp. FL1651]
MDDTDDAAAAMAEAMGFSSFGAQKPNKRRKFNPSTDAVVAPSSTTTTSTLPLHRQNDGRKATTGSNTTPLGIRKHNKDEVDLGDDEDHVAPANVGAQPAMTDSSDEDPEPQYLDTSRPSAPIDTDSAVDLQFKIDAIVDGSAPPYTPSQAGNTAVGGGYPSRGGRGGRQHNRARDESGNKWWEDYYDPTFIINPWDKLERSMGLGSRGLWVSLDEAKAAQV